MSVEDLLQVFPAKRIKAMDGMSVTADVWGEAHDYHSQQLRFHTLAGHGWGIVSGLEVIGSEPPDTSVYILPGVAVDRTGQTIVLPQPVAYDVGREMEGLIYLLLNYGESRPRPSNGGGPGSGPLYVQSEFSIVARTQLPATPYVELARVRRRGRVDPFLDARNPNQPGVNEIDLRYRREMGAPVDASIGVCYMGQKADRRLGVGAANLARLVNRLGYAYVTVYDEVPLAPGVETNTLIYLVGQGDFELSPGQMNGLSNFVKRGRGTLLLESNDPVSEAVFTSALGDMDMVPQPLAAGHRLLTDPYLFSAPPPGYAAQANAEVMVTDGIVFSKARYGLIWRADGSETLPSRERIRSALEWGCNVVGYAVDRRRRR
jgi:hypothetical protein